MITYESICKKLGFDAASYKGDIVGTEYDDEENPFDILTVEELKFLMSYFMKHK